MSISAYSSVPDVVPQVALPWVIRLRLAMAAAQLILAGITVYVLHVEWHWLWWSLPPILIASSNVLLMKQTSQLGVSRETLVALAFVLDILCLTVLLIGSGGANNPFSLLYLVHITLSATILTKRWTWLLGFLSTTCFALMFWVYRPIPLLEVHHRSDTANLHLLGMWFSFAVAAFLVAMFSGKISELLRRREQELRKLETELAKKDRLASLATLAAGAAHELGTPLGTIAVVAKELEIFATQVVKSESMIADSRLIRQEVDRCREILHGMSARDAELAHEPATEVTVSELLSPFQQRSRLRLLIPQELESLSASLPRRMMQRTLSVLVKNALEASGQGEVAIKVTHQPDRLMFQILDRGEGMSPEVLRRVGEPFFTTKDPGRGMGLGVFLARTFVEQIGGCLRFQSSEGAGTEALLEVPMTCNMRVENA